MWWVSSARNVDPSTITTTMDVPPQLSAPPTSEGHSFGVAPQQDHLVPVFVQGPSPVPDGALWHPEEEMYLVQLSETCRQLAAIFRNSFEKNKHRLAMFKIPAILLGSVSGLAATGGSAVITNQEMQKWVSLAVGVTSIGIAVLNSIESYMRVAELMSTSLHASLLFHKLAEDVTVELALKKRSVPGIVFLKEAYSKYQHALEMAPPIRQIKFVSLPLGAAATTTHSPPVASLHQPPANADAPPTRSEVTTAAATTSDVRLLAQLHSPAKSVMATEVAAKRAERAERTAKLTRFVQRSEASQVARYETPRTTIESYK
jgi:hypothetical protein